jgi:hypothetical protein
MRLGALPFVGWGGARRVLISGHSRGILLRQAVNPRRQSDLEASMPSESLSCPRCASDVMVVKTRRSQSRRAFACRGPRPELLYCKCRCGINFVKPFPIVRPTKAERT